jgi:hypothetical protein
VPRDCSHPVFKNPSDLLAETNRPFEAETAVDRARVARCSTRSQKRTERADKLGKAEPLHREALNLARKNYWLNDPRVATCQNNLALVRVGMGALEEAEQLLGSCLPQNANSGPPEGTRSRLHKGTN